MSNVQVTLDQLVPIFNATEAVLSAWNEKGNLQFPVLVGAVAVRLGWTEEDIRKNEPQVRYYVRNHPEWHITRGAKGGIQRKAEHAKKEALQASQRAAKEQIKAVIDAKLAGV